MIDFADAPLDVRGAVLQHLFDDDGFTGLHTNLKASDCVCFVPPGMDGPTCVHCGGMTKRSGTCATCVECGETTGCG